MTLERYSKRVLVLFILVTAASSSELKFERVLDQDGAVSGDVDTGFIFPEMQNTKVTCYAYLDDTDNNSDVELIWEIDGTTVTDDFNYESSTDRIDVTHEITYSDAQANKPCYCIMRVKSGGETKVTHKTEFPLAAIELKFDDATPKVIAAKGQTFTLTCVLTGYDFSNYVGDESLSLQVRDVDADNTVSLVDGNWNYDGQDMVAKFTPATSSLGETKYRCELDDYGGRSEGNSVVNTVQVIGLDSDLSEKYYVEEGGEVSVMEAKVADYDWSDSSSPEITFKKNGVSQTPTIGAAATVSNVPVTDSPVSFKVEYQGKKTGEVRFAPGFTLESTVAVIKELKIEGDMDIVTGNTMTITCSIPATSVSEYTINLIRDDSIITTTSSDATYEAKLSIDTNLKGGIILSYSFSISTMTMGTDDKAYKCSITDKVTSLSLTPTIYDFQKSAADKPWLLNAAESPALTCYIEGKALAGRIKWKDATNSAIENGVDEFEIEEDLQNTRTVSTLTKNNVALTDQQAFTCYVGPTTHTFDVKVIEATVTASKVFVTEDLDVEIECKVPDANVDQFTIEWKNPSGVAIAGAKFDPKTGTGRYTCAVFEKDSSKIDPNSVTLTVDVFTLSVSTPSVIYWYLPTDESKTVTCQYQLAPVPGDLDDININYKFLSSADSVYQNTENAEFVINPLEDRTVLCDISMTGASGLTVISGTVRSDHVLQQREIYVTEHGQRYVYETPGAAKITCHLTAESSEINQGFTPLWYQDDQLIPNPTGVEFSVIEGNLFQSVLTIGGVDDSAAGAYKCKLSNVESNKVTTLVVKKVLKPTNKPIFWMGTETVNIDFEVERVGNVDLKITVGQSTAADMSCNDQGDCTYTSSHTRSDSDLLQDQELNVVIVASGSLEGQSLLGDVLDIPTFIVKIFDRTFKGLENKACARGKNVDMECEAKVEDDVEIKWMKGDEDVTDSAEQGAYVNLDMTRKSTLKVEVTDETEEQMKSYSCIAYYGSAGGKMKLQISDDFVVLEKPTLDTVGDIVKDETDSTHEVDEGDNLGFKCTPDQRVTVFESYLYKNALNAATMEKKDTYSEYDVGKAELSDATTYFAEVTYNYNGEEYKATSEAIAVVVKEIAKSVDYVSSDDGITMTVKFSGTLKAASASWYDETSKQIYKVKDDTNPDKRDAEVVVSQNDDSTIINIPPGFLADSTSFKVSAKLEDDTDVTHRQYVQVFQKLAVKKIIAEESEETVIVEMLIPVIDYSGTPTVTTTPESIKYETSITSNTGVKVTIWVAAATAKADDKTMAATITLNEDSVTEATITFELAGRATLTMQSAVLVKERASVSLHCNGDQSIIDKSNNFQATLLINDNPVEDVSVDKKTYYTIMTIPTSSYTKHNGRYVCQVTYYTKEMGDVTVTSEGTDVNIEGFDSTTDYVVKEGGITLTAYFSRLIDRTTVQWFDEISGKTYTVGTNPINNNNNNNNDLQKRNAENYVVVEENTAFATLTLPQGVVLQSTSFVVSAKLSDDPREYRRKYLQVFDPVPLSSVTIYDVAQIAPEGTVMGQVEIGISDYEGTPEVNFNTAVLKHDFDMTAADKVTFKVWPTQSMLVAENSFVIEATITLNEASSAVARITFYPIDIDTSPAITVGESDIEVVYDERMNDEEKAETAFSCTFQDEAGEGTLLGGDIKHMASETILVSGLTQTVSVNFDKLTQMEKEEDEEKEEVYGCGFQFKYGGVATEFGRQFTVKLKPDDRNWGAIIAACVIAGLILLLIIAFIIYRCCCIKRRRKEKQIPPDLKTSRSAVQETNISSPETHPKFNDAVNFLDNVQNRFEKQPDIYRTFLNTLTEFRSKKINKPDLARKVEILFEGHPDLVAGFNDFLRSRKKNAHENAGNEYTVVDLQGEKNGEVHTNKAVAEGKV